MTHTTHAGICCRTIHQLRTVEGDLPRGNQGTVLNEVENLGRLLVIVQMKSLSPARQRPWP